jgi:hypothetical protein
MAKKARVSAKSKKAPAVKRGKISPRGMVPPLKCMEVDDGAGGKIVLCWDEPSQRYVFYKHIAGYEVTDWDKPPRPPKRKR